MSAPKKMCFLVLKFYLCQTNWGSLTSLTKEVQCPSLMTFFFAKKQVLDLDKGSFLCIKPRLRIFLISKNSLFKCCFRSMINNSEHVNQLELEATRCICILKISTSYLAKIHNVNLLYKWQHLKNDCWKLKIRFETYAKGLKL